MIAIAVGADCFVSFLIAIVYRVFLSTSVMKFSFVPSLKIIKSHYAKVTTLPAISHVQMI